MSFVDALRATWQNMLDPYWWWVMSSLILFVTLIARFVARRSWRVSVLSGFAYLLFWRVVNAMIFGQK